MTSVSWKLFPAMQRLISSPAKMWRQEAPNGSSTHTKPWNQHPTETPQAMRQKPHPTELQRWRQIAFQIPSVSPLDAECRRERQNWNGVFSGTPQPISTALSGGL
jgi:hypothetical protein